MARLDELIKEYCLAGMEYKRIGDIANYEQPGNYLVHSTDYKDEYKTPVLTAGQTFILGYTNETEGVYNKGEVIIYDDFTMDTKYVDFCFKVKSSTIKMLTPKQDVDLYFRVNPEFCVNSLLNFQNDV